MMADRLDAVAVGITKEGGVIGGVIAAQARRAVVGAAGRDACIPEGIDLALPARLEAPVPAEGFFRLRALADREIDAVRIGGPRPLAIAQPVLATADLDHTKRLHDGVVEALGSGDVGDGDGYVVEHAVSTLTVPATHTGASDAFFSRSSASCSFVLRATAASRFSFSSSTISSGALATNFSLASLASTRLMSPSALPISFSSRARSAARSITPFSGRAATSPRTRSCTAPSGALSANETSARRDRRLMTSFQRWARAFVSADAPARISGVKVAGGMFISARTERIAVTRSTTQPISASASGSLNSPASSAMITG